MSFWQFSKNSISSIVSSNPFSEISSQRPGHTQNANISKPYPGVYPLPLQQPRSTDDDHRQQPDYHCQHHQQPEYPTPTLAHDLRPASTNYPLPLPANKQTTYQPIPTSNKEHPTPPTSATQTDQMPAAPIATINHQHQPTRPTYLNQRHQQQPPSTTRSDNCPASISP